jgi:hypothetical protein
MKKEKETVSKIDRTSTRERRWKKPAILALEETASFPSLLSADPVHRRPQSRSRGAPESVARPPVEARWHGRRRGVARADLGLERGERLTELLAWPPALSRSRGSLPGAQ